MDINEFKKNGHMIIDWIADYFKEIEKYPVRSKAAPGDIISRLPAEAPVKPEKFDKIFNDFENIIMPGMTHWQSPNFFAYFPANNSFESILGELLSSAIGAQCMSWATSPAAAELEEAVMNQLAAAIGLPRNFSGVIEDTASTSTLCAILTAREARSDYSVNKDGPGPAHKFRGYCSEQAHSSIEKAFKIAGLGKNNLRKIECDGNFAISCESLEAAIKKDIKAGFVPLIAVAAIGTTGSTAIDPLSKIADICKKYNIWLHADAAYAGNALILPEMRYMIDGIEGVDSFVFNPHKWMFTNFDCSAYFVKDKASLIRTFEILPEYLKTNEKHPVNNYRDWGIQLGRRFRALKLWFVLRSYGLSGLGKKIKKHISLAQYFARELAGEKGFEIMAPHPLAVVCFRYKPLKKLSAQKTNELNASLLEKLNETGRLYLSHTKLGEDYVIRMSIGQTNVEKRHVKTALALIIKTARQM